MRRHSPWYRVLLTAIVVGILVPACGAPSPAPTGDPVTITFACKDYQRNLYEELVKGFHNANPDVTVQLVSADEASGMRQQGSTVSSSGNEIEELAARTDTFVWFAQLSPTDWPYLLNLQPFVDDDTSFPADDFYPGTLDDLRWQGNLHGLPGQIAPVLIFYDKGMFDQVGMAYPEVGWDWDALLDAADKLSEREGDKVTRYGFVDSFFPNTVLAMMHQHGVRLWDKDPSPPRPQFDRSEVSEVVRRYVDLILTHRVMPMPEIGSNVMASNLVNEGKAAMWTGFAFNYGYHAQRIDLGLVPFPEEVTAANPRSMEGFFASAGTAHTEATWRWLTYLSEHYQPLASGFLSSRRSTNERLGWWQKLDKETKAIIKYALTHPTPPENPLNIPLKVAIMGVSQGEADIEEALATAQSRALELQAELAAVPAATSQPVAAPQPTPVSIATIITFAPANSADMPIYRELSETYHENHPDTRVEVVSPVLGALAERALSSDCFGSPASLLASPEIAKHIRSLQPLIDTDASFKLTDFYPTMLEPLQRDGELWGLPHEADALMVYYNRERLVEANAPLPAPGWRFDEFLDVAVALSDGDHFGFTTSEGAYGDLLVVLERLGARMFDSSSEDGPAVPIFDDPTVVTALGQYADAFRRRPLSPRTPSQRSGWPNAAVIGGHPDGVQTGQVAMWIDHISTHDFAPSLPFDVGIAPLPARSSGVGPAEAQTSTEFDVMAYYISAYAADPQSCWKWLSFLGSRPEAVQMLPARRSTAASPDWQTQVDETVPPAYQATLEYHNTSILRLRWESPWLAYTYPWLDEAFQATVAGENAKQALNEAQRRAEAYVQCLERGEGFTDPETMRNCAVEADPGYPGLGE
jgi:multiple sugar transport system substrate-binding protein